MQRPLEAYVTRHRDERDADAPGLVPLVRAGVRFVDGVRVEREAQDRKRRAA